MVANACNPGYLGGWGERIALAQEFKAAVSCFMPLGMKSETLSLSQKQTNKYFKKLEKRKTTNNSNKENLFPE